MKNVFYYMLKDLFVLFFFGYLEKRLDKKATVNCRIYDVTDWTTSNCNLHIIQYLKKYKSNRARNLLVNKA